MTVEIRPVGDDEAAWAEFIRVDALAFGATAEPDNPDWALRELDRTVLAWDGGEAVGCGSAFTFDLSLPGGSVPAAGVTWIGVVPTHRRRGVMSAVLAELHRAALSAGQPIATLWASQSPIYPRFGYGVASHCYRMVIPSNIELSRAPETPDVTVLVMGSGNDAELTRPVYDQARRSRPGAPAQSEAWHAYRVADRPADRDGYSELRTFVATRAGTPVGYARYHTKHDWTRGIGEGNTLIEEMVALDPGAAAALWRHVHSLELMARTEAWNAPIDDPVLSWVSESRYVELGLREQLYVRILDLPAALAARTFRCDVDVVLEVTDSAHPDNAGRWRVSGDSTGATCERTTAAADLAMDIRQVGATLLGSTTFVALASAAAVDVRRSSCLDRVSIAFSHPSAAWCPGLF